MDEKGTGFLDISAELLAEFPLLQMMPRAFQLVGTSIGERGVCRFVFESAEIRGTWVRLRVTVEESNFQRKLVVDVG